MSQTVTEIQNTTTTQTLRTTAYRRIQVYTAATQKDMARTISKGSRQAIEVPLNTSISVEMG